MIKKILVTGTNGHLGREFKKYCQKKKVGVIPINNFKQIKKFKNISALVHFQFYISKKRNNTLVKKNLNNVKKLSNYCNVNNIKIIFISSCAADLNINSYTRSKKLCENYLLDYSKKMGLKNIILRLYNVYSYSLNSRGVISDLVKKIKKQKKVIINNYLNSRDFIHSNDVYNLILKTLNKNKNGVYEVGTAKTISIYKLGVMINNFQSKKTKLVKGKQKKTKKNYYSIANIIKTKRHFKWKVKTNLSQGIFNLINA